MQLAVNTLVVVILSLFILSLALLLVSKIWQTGERTLEEVPQQLKKELFNALWSSKARMFSLENVQTVERGKDVFFTVGIQNDLSETTSFVVDVSYDSVE